MRNSVKKKREGWPGVGKNSVTLAIGEIENVNCCKIVLILLTTVLST